MHKLKMKIHKILLIQLKKVEN